MEEKLRPVRFVNRWFILLVLSLLIIEILIRWQGINQRPKPIALNDFEIRCTQAERSYPMTIVTVEHGELRSSWQENNCERITATIRKLPKPLVVYLSQRTTQFYGIQGTYRADWNAEYGRVRGFRWWLYAVSISIALFSTWVSRHRALKKV